MKKRKNRFFTVFGILLLAAAAGIFIMTSRTAQRCTEQTIAKLADYRTDYDAEDHSATYFPIVEFLADGTRVEAVSASGSNRQPYEFGADVEIRYNPEDPSEFVFVGDRSGVKWAVYLIVIGIGCIVLDILSARGILPESETKHHATRRTLKNRGLSVDLMGIAQAAQVAKTIKGSLGGLKEMSAEERRAYFEDFQAHPEKYVSVNEMQQADDE